MKNDTDTPEVDEAINNNGGVSCLEDFESGDLLVRVENVARKLERERNEARELAEYWMNIATEFEENNEKLPWEKE